MSMKRAIYPVELKASGDAGQVEALVSIFGNVDLQGDRVVPGAFTKSIAEWKASGDPVPVVFSHDWGDMWSHIGMVDTLEETAKGLRAVYTLDIADNPAAAQVFKLLKRRTLKEHSFAYDVVDERRAKDGANELTELKIIEVGPTLKGANPDTELLTVKSLVDDGPAKDQLDDAIKKTADEAVRGVTLGAGGNGSSATVVSFVSNGSITATDVKAGRRLSQATQAEMQAIREDANALMARVDSLIGVREHAAALVARMDVLLGIAEDTDVKSIDPAGAEPGDTGQQIDTEKQADDREPLPAKSDDDLLRYRTRIEEMCATPRSTK